MVGERRVTRNKLLHFAKTLIFGVSHLGAVAVVSAVFWPMARWYYNAKPLWGVDFFYTASLLRIIKDNLTVLPSAWNYAWSSGWPIQLNYPVLYYYALIPLTRFFLDIDAIKIGNIISLLLFFVGCYAAFCTLSKSRIVGVILTIAAIFSVGVYGAMMWGGSLPNHASMMFYPWVTFFIIRYVDTTSLRYLASSILLTGLAVLTHPQVPLAYIFPTSAAILLFYPYGKRFMKKILTLLLYMTVSIIIALPLLYTSFTSVRGVLENLVKTEASSEAESTVKAPAIDEDIVAFQRRQPLRMFEDTHPGVYLFLGVASVAFLVSLIVARSKQTVLVPVLFSGLAGIYALYITAFAYGISIFHGGWYRLFWSVPFVFGMAGAAFWGSMTAHITKRFSQQLTMVISIVLSIAIAGGAYLVIPKYTAGVREKIVMRSNPSSAFPDKINMSTSQEEIAKLKRDLVPDWLDPNNIDYRLYSGDQTLNIWWSALYRMPAARGYLDPPKSDFLFWMDASLSQTPEGEDQLVKSFGYPQEVAIRNTLYLLDWYAVKYFEGGRESQAAFAPMPKSIDTDEYIKQKTLLDLNEGRYTKTNNTLKYHEFKDELVSPTMTGTNSPVVGVVGSEDGFSTVVRALADTGMGLRHVIPVRLGKELDKLDKTDFATVDLLILYDYSYYNRNKAFRQVEQYVNSGGKVYIESGIETKESYTQGLPELFPFSSTDRKQLGSEWNLEYKNTDFSDADLNAFSPPLFDREQWNFSLPGEGSVLVEDAEVILTNHGKPVLIQKPMGEGKVIWSGMNFLYHVIRFHNESEIELLTDIIGTLVKISPDTSIVVGSGSFISSQKREFKVKDIQGILFKEQAYPGWKVALKAGGKIKQAKVYQAGPAYPGFIFVSVPEEMHDKEVLAAFSYRGDRKRWFFTVLSVLVSVALLGTIVLGKFAANTFLAKGVKKMRKLVGKWWEREE